MDWGAIGVIIQRGPRLPPRRLDEAEVADAAEGGERGHDLHKDLICFTPALSTRIEGEFGRGLLGRAPTQSLHLLLPNIAALPFEAHGPDAAADDGHAAQVHGSPEFDTYELGTHPRSRKERLRASIHAVPRRVPGVKTRRRQPIDVELRDLVR